MKYLNTFLLFSLFVQGSISTSDFMSKNKSLRQFHFTGQALIDMGIKLDKPFLKLIGKTVMRVENQMNEISSSSLKTKDLVAEICRLHPCSEWNEWSKCDAINYGDFGGQTRSRNCGLNTTLCKYSAPPTVVHDSRVCEHKCPKNYTSTGHGFCLILYDNKKLARDDAEKAYQADGGHLVNVDSDIKVRYVNQTILEHGYSGRTLLWIDGRRSKQGGPFTYGYKTTDPSFSFWGDNDPDNGADELCMIYHKAPYTNNFWRWFDYPCKEKLAFICQYQ